MNRGYMIIEVAFDTPLTDVAAIEREFFRQNFTEGSMSKIIGLAELHNEQGEIIYQAQANLVG